MKVTLAEVASRAGVSPTTAARVIHDNGYVSDENRKRVEQSVRDLGYQPNMLARGLRNNRSYVVGLVLSSASQNPYFTRVSHAVRTAANEAGLAVLNFNHTYDAEVERQGIQRMIKHGVEAVFTCHIFDPRNIEPVLALRIPVIEIERSTLAGVSRLEFDPIPGMRAAVGAFLAAGHRNIAFLGGTTSVDFLGPEPPDSVEMQRAAAFRSALAHHGLNADAARLEFADYITPSGAVWAQKALRERNRPTALICGSDVLAAGVLQVAYELDLKVPRDLAIAGYDDSLASFLAPPISSISQPYLQLGETLLSMVQEIRQGGGASIERILPTSFVSRTSL